MKGVDKKQVARGRLYNSSKIMAVNTTVINCTVV